MKRIIKAALATMTAITIFGCSSSSSEATGTEVEETSKEPELVKIELNKDNWQDYFDLYIEPIIQSDAYYTAGAQTVKLKKEYSELLDNNENSVLKFDYEVHRGLYYCTLEGNKITIGDKVDVENTDFSIYGEGFVDAGPVYADWEQNHVNSGNLTITNEEMINGKGFVNYGLQRTSENQSNDEAVWGLFGATDLKITNVSGSIYIWE